MKTVIYAFLLMFSLSHSAFAKEVKIPFGELTLNGELLLADGKTLKDGVVLFTHGTWMNNNYSTANTLKNYLPDSGINILTINLSFNVNDRHDNAMISCDRIHTHKHTDAMKEIGAWVKWLEKQGVHNITLAGHSRGGNQTAWYASEHNADANIKHVVLFAPQLWSKKSEIAEYKQRFHKDLTKEVAKADKLVKAGKGNEVMPHTDLVYCEDAKVTAASFASYYDFNPNMDTVHLLPKIKKPVLVFAGTDDTVVKDLPERMKPVLQKHANIHLDVIDGATHFYRDFAGEDAVEKMVSFIQKD
ncbi:alpha/beta hydrolase [Hydrogenovibrio kuenenii]|uniref:alpha/beta hydrolase n=1 Tax=Hydrogenovibrio kuenenii TaxID=63658 RepID=UPI000570EEAB|nr:alpha/beta fold hydrolase [Hydrogenovibrio kuenenii]